MTTGIWDAEFVAAFQHDWGKTLKGSLEGCGFVIQCGLDLIHTDMEKGVHCIIGGSNSFARLSRLGIAVGLLPTATPPAAARRGARAAEAGGSADGGSGGDEAELREWTEIMDAGAFGLRFEWGPDGEPIWPAFWRRRFWTRPDGSLGEHGVDDARGRGGYWGRRLPAQDFMDEHLAQTFQDSDGKFRGVPPSPADREEWAALSEAEREWALSDECTALYAEMEARQAELAARQATHEARLAREVSTWGGVSLAGDAADAEDGDGPGADADDGGGGSGSVVGGEQVPGTADPAGTAGAAAMAVAVPMPVAAVPPPIIVGLPDPEAAQRRQKEIAARKRREQAQREEDEDRANERRVRGTW